MQNHPHDHWRDILPYYIAAYKSSSSSSSNSLPNITKDKATLWYRLSPSSSASSVSSAVAGATQILGSAPWEPRIAASAVVQDRVFFTTLLKEPDSTVSIQIGDGSQGADTFHVSKAGLYHNSVPFKGRTGEVVLKVQRGGEIVVPEVKGKAIQAAPGSGGPDFNAWVGGSG